MVLWRGHGAGRGGSGGLYGCMGGMSFLVGLMLNLTDGRQEGGKIERVLPLTSLFLEENLSLSLLDFFFFFLE